MTAAPRGWTRRRAAVIAALGAALAVAVVFAATSLLGQGAAATAPTLLLALPPVAGPAGPALRAGSDGGLVVAATAAAYAASPELPAAEPLAPAPDPALLEAGGGGIGLPRIAADGRQPWQAYARPFDRRDGRARLVLIVLDVGLSRAASEAAVYRLPAAVTVAIDAYAAAPQQWAAAARRAGHEVLADLPLQAAAASGEDAGPLALAADDDDDGNLQRAQAMLGRFAGYTGVLMRGGGAFADGLTRLEPLLRDLRHRGLLLVDGPSAEGAPLFRLGGRAGLPQVRLDALIAGDAAGIDRQLDALAAAARERFVAVAALRPTPVAIERLRTFLARLDAGRYVLAPVSAVAAAEAG